MSCAGALAPLVKGSWFARALPLLALLSWQEPHVTIPNPQRQLLARDIES